MDKTIDVDGLNLNLTNMSFNLKIDIYGFCQLFEDLYDQTLPAPDSVGTWWMIAPNRHAAHYRVVKNDDGQLVTQGKKAPPDHGRWVKVFDDYIGGDS